MTLFRAGVCLSRKSITGFINTSWTGFEPPKEPEITINNKWMQCAACAVMRSHPQHLVEVVVLLPSGVQQEGVQEEPGVGSQPQHLLST